METQTKRKTYQYLQIECAEGLSSQDSGIGSMTSPTTDVTSEPFSEEFQRLSMEDKKTLDDRIQKQEVVEEDKIEVNDCQEQNLCNENCSPQTSHERKVELYYLQQIFDQDEDGDTLLHVYISKRQTAAVYALLQLKPALEDVNLQNRYQQTALHLATFMNCAITVRLLLMYGADVELVDEEGKNIWHIAAEKENHFILGIICYLYKSGVLPHDVQAGLRRMLNSRNFAGQSPLHLAVKLKRKQCVHLLLEVGANKEARDYASEYAPLHYAAESGDTELVTYLLHQRNVHIQPVGRNGVTPLHLATSYGHAAVVALLLGVGADPECKTYEGSSALSFATNEEVLMVFQEMAFVQTQKLI